MKPVLITCHGYTGYPEEMEPLGIYFQNRGFEWVNLCLPGHNTTPEDLKNTKWKEWTDYVTEQVKIYTESNRNVVFAGLSLGGAMTLYALEHHPKIKVGIALGAPTIILTGFNRLLSKLPLLNFWINKSERDSFDVVDPVEEVHRDYKRHHTKSVKELNNFVDYVRKNLDKINQPLFLIHGEQDRVIPVNSANIIEAGVSSKAVKKLIVNAGHVLTRETKRESWFEKAFIFATGVLPVQTD